MSQVAYSIVAEFDGPHAAEFELVLDLVLREALEELLNVPLDVNIDLSVVQIEIPDDDEDNPDQ